MRRVFIDVNYFRKGDYTRWFDEEVPNGEMTYHEWLENKLIPRLEKYESLVLYEDGTLYGIIGNTSELISDNEFEDAEDFEAIAKEYEI
jgi:hypothetical protein